MSANPLQEALQKVPLFDRLPLAVIAELADFVVPVRLQEGEVLFRQGDPGDSLYIILAGRVSIVTPGAHGRELVIDRYGPGEIVGELAMIDQEPRSAGVVAAEPTELLRLPGDAFLNALAGHPALALGVLHNLSARLRFTAAYLQKAIEWAAYIAGGDYSAALAQMETARAGERSGGARGVSRQEEFLAAFVNMVRDVQDREETLKAQLQAFQIHIDEARRQEEVEDLLGSRFFQQLKDSVRRRKSGRDLSDTDDPDVSPGRPAE